MSILFQADWTDDKGQLRAIPHATTKNTSFLRHCQVLKRMGIRNYAFPLALYNPELKHVDVHDLEENTPENERLRAAVMVEARHNAWYFLRECVRIYSQGGKPVPFRLDRGNCAMVWSFLNGIDYTGMQPRQAQPLDAVVRTPTGSMSMGDVVVGTEVLGPDGTTIKVVAVHPLGEREVFKVTLSNGGSTRCCKDHLWRVYSEDGFGFTYETLSLEEIDQDWIRTPQSILYKAGFHTV